MNKQDDFDQRFNTIWDGIFDDILPRVVGVNVRTPQNNEKSNNQSKQPDIPSSCMELKFNRVSRELDDTRRRLNAANARFIEFTSSVAKQHRQIELNDAAIRAKDEMLSRLTVENERLKQQLADAHEAIRKDMEKAEAAHESAAQFIQSLECANKQMRNELGSAKGLFDDAIAQVVKLEKENYDLREEKAKVESFFEKLPEEYRQGWITTLPTEAVEPKKEEPIIDVHGTLEEDNDARIFKLKWVVANNRVQDVSVWLSDHRVHLSSIVNGRIRLHSSELDEFIDIFINAKDPRSEVQDFYLLCFATRILQSNTNSDHVTFVTDVFATHQALKAFIKHVYGLMDVPEGTFSKASLLA